MSYNNLLLKVSALIGQSGHCMTVGLCICVVLVSLYIHLFATSDPELSWYVAFLFSWPFQLHLHFSPMFTLKYWLRFSNCKVLNLNQFLGSGSKICIRLQKVHQVMAYVCWSRNITLKVDQMLLECVDAVYSGTVEQDWVEKM